MRLESLESRMTPATTSLVGGVLSISAQVGPLTVSTTTTSGSISVVDNVTNTVFNGVTTLNITGTGSADTISLNVGTGPHYNFPPNREFVGNVTINGGNGGDTINLAGFGGFGDEGYITGNLTINGGNGLDTVNLNNNFSTSGSTTLTNVSKVDMGVNAQFATGGNFTVNGSNNLNMLLDGFFLGVGGALGVRFVLTVIVSDLNGQRDSAYTWILAPRNTVS